MKKRTLIDEFIDKLKENPSRDWRYDPDRNWELYQDRNWEIDPDRNWKIDPDRNPDYIKEQYRLLKKYMGKYLEDE